MTDELQWKHKEFDGRTIAAGLNEETREAAASLKESGWAPRLVSVVIGDAASVEIYVRNQKRTAEKLGIAFDERYYPEGITEPEMLAAVQAMNADPRVTGIIVQRPVPPQINIKRLQSAIHPLKDVEGLHPASVGNIVYNELDLGPCTAMASVHILKTTGLELSGLEVVVVGHSEIVGKPIAFLLMAEGATVTVCHHRTRNLAVHCRQADAVFVAVGKPGPCHRQHDQAGSRGNRYRDQPRDRTRRHCQDRRRLRFQELPRSGRLDNAGARRCRSGDSCHAHAQHDRRRPAPEGILRQCVRG